MQPDCDCSPIVKRIRIHTVLLMLAVVFSRLPLFAHTTVYSVGVRGGAQTVLPKIKSGETWSVTNAYTGGGVVDFRYAYYNNISYSCLWGFYIGLGAGMSSEALKGNLTDHYMNWDYDDSPMDYTVQSGFRQTTTYARAELSMMLAFYFGPVIFNIGPRFVLPFATRTKMTLNDLSISAYYTQYGVRVTNERITGWIDLPYSKKVKADRSYGILLVGAEVGYEWNIAYKSYIGLLAYADIGIFHAGSPLGPSDKPMIDVAPILNQKNPIPEVEMHSITNYVGNLRNMEFGLRVYYAFSNNLQYDRRGFR